MIWKRYFLQELFKVFFLFLGGFYFLYVLIDYSTHSKLFHQEGIAFVHILLYYFFQLTKRADLLVPIALLIATVKVLTTLNSRNEIVALISAGVPLKKLMHPFLLTAVFCALLLYLNFQFVQPHSLSSLSQFEKSHLKGRSYAEPVNALPLTDSSVLLYQTFDPEKQTVEEVFWVKDSDHIYRMQTLDLSQKPPLGDRVDFFERKEGELRRSALFETLSFPALQFDHKNLTKTLTPPHSQSLTQLLSHLSAGDAKLVTTLFYKLAIPFTCLLVVLAPAPFCLRTTRHLPIFTLFALSLFGIITFFTFVNSCVILGQSQVIPPFWAILTPFALFFTLFGWRYAKL